MKLFEIKTPTFTTTRLGSNITRTRNNAKNEFGTEFLKVNDITKNVEIDLTNLQVCLDDCGFTFEQQDVIIGLVSQYENCIG